MEETQKRRTTTNEDLSNDTIVEILHLLPLNSIIQCFNVCKRWQSLISIFHTANVAMISHHGDDKYMCLKKGQRRMQISELDFSVDFPRQITGEKYEVLLSSCNGLLFSYYFIRGRADLDECYISNPWIKECVRLPNPTILSCDNCCLYGLAFENKSCNNVALYKIVMVRKTKACYPAIIFQIYSSDKKRWQLLQMASELNLCLSKLDQKTVCCSWTKLDPNAVYCKGRLYWQCHEKDYALMFNLETECSGCLDLPRDNDENDSRLTECDGHLHYIRTRSGGRRLSVLKMSMSGEWLIFHDVDIQGAMERHLELSPMHRKKMHLPDFAPIDLSCQGDDKVLLLDKYKRIVSYDLKRDMFELVLEKDLYLVSKFFRYTPTNQSILSAELQHGLQTERSRQFKQLFNEVRKPVWVMITWSIIVLTFDNLPGLHRKPQH